MDYRARLDELKVVPLETSCQDQKYLVCCQDRYFEVNESIVKLMDIIRQTDSLEEVTQQYNSYKNTDYSCDDIQFVLTKYVAPFFETGRKQLSPLIVKKEIIPAEAISKFSKLGKYLFPKKIIISCLAVLILLEILFCVNYVYFNTPGIGRISEFYNLGIAFILFIFSSLIHEIGHASACKYYGLNHGGVGIGLYLNIPVLYTDVSEVWKLPRKKRLVVNIAGAYFQFLLLIPVLLLYFITGSNVFKYFIIAVNFNFIFVLNPFFKFDGYWIASDLLGVPNLRKRSREVFGYYRKKLFGKPVMEKPYLLTINKKERIVGFVYATVVNLFFLFYFVFVMPRFLVSFFRNFPPQFIHFLNQLSLGLHPDLATIKSLASSLIFFLLTIYILYRFFGGFFKRRKRAE